MATTLFKLSIATLLVALVTSCGTDDTPAPLDRVGLGAVENSVSYAAIEVTTDGAQGTLTAIGIDNAGKQGYEVLLHERSRTKGANFIEDGHLTPEERRAILQHVDTVATALQSQQPQALKIYLVLSAEYEETNAADGLRAAVQTTYPGLVVQTLTPELEAKANYLTMLGRTDVPLSDYVLVDIGSNFSIFSIYDYPATGAVEAYSVPYGTRSTHKLVDPLGDLRVSRIAQRQRIERLVRDSVEIQIKQILRQPGFAERHEIMFMGGLVYKIIRSLDIPMTGRPIDFSRDSEAELPAKFRAMLEEPTSDLQRGPNYSVEEMFAALIVLETIMDEYGDGQSAHFFERATWLPGLILYNVLGDTRKAEDDTASSLGEL